MIMLQKATQNHKLCMKSVFRVPMSNKAIEVFLQKFKIANIL